MPKKKSTPIVTTSNWADGDSKAETPVNSRKGSAQDELRALKEKMHDIALSKVDHYPAGKSYCTSVYEVPVTAERKPYCPQPKDNLKDPGTARATIAASNESPNGTTEGNWAASHQHQTVVQQHVAYWDADNDGIIWPRDTYNGMRAWGWSIPLCLFATFIINFNLSYPTVNGYSPDPYFRIFVKNLHKDKHGSDSATFDHEGRFVPQSFEDLFAKYDRGNKGGLDLGDLVRAQKGQRLPFDFFGWFAAIFEWTATYLLLWPEDGILRKEEVRRVFDGSIFQKKADEYARKKRSSAHI